jgi:hypothetical protein
MEVDGQEIADKDGLLPPALRQAALRLAAVPEHVSEIEASNFLLAFPITSLVK